LLIVSLITSKIAEDQSLMASTSPRLTLWFARYIQHRSHYTFFSPRLTAYQYILQGSHPKVDSYSAFADNKYFEITELAKHLFTRHIDTVIIVGLAADYCVKETALDARKFGFRTILIKDGTRAVIPDNFETCMEALSNKGVQVTTIGSDSFKAEFLS
jgi:nicotinamidase/pyrazinamidase